MNEMEIKEFVSETFLTHISDYAIQTILRRVLYYNKNIIDWNDFYEQIITQMPELDNKRRGKSE